ncbi:MAG: glutamate formimidoyltransferase [Candidatus Bathyarchaeaceae archaeon]
MREIIECVPNFSTSDPAVVESILKEIKRVKGTYLLDHIYDAHYNRLVVSYIGNANAVYASALNSAIKAIELIDMNKHKGQHPRIGSVDVVPFIPIRNVNMKDCIDLAKKFGKTLAEKCNIPVYLYGDAATSPERSDLDWIRLGEYEKLHEMIKKPERKPDFGPAFPHPTAGATITGARKVMVGFNVNLGTPDIKIAKKIAKALHAKKGGLAFVKAMAAEIPERGITQIGMSISDFEKTPLHRVFELIKIESERYNVRIVGSEFCGLAPLRVITDAAAHYLKIDDFNENGTLEVAIQKAIEKGREEGV